MTAKAKLSRQPCLAPFAAYLRHAKRGVAKQGLKPLPITTPSRWDGKISQLKTTPNIRSAPLNLMAMGDTPVAGRAGAPTAHEH